MGASGLDVLMRSGWRLNCIFTTQSRSVVLLVTLPFNVNLSTRRAITNNGRSLEALGLIV